MTSLKVELGIFLVAKKSKRTGEKYKNVDGLTSVYAHYVSFTHQSTLLPEQTTCPCKSFSYKINNEINI